MYNFFLYKLITQICRCSFWFTLLLWFDEKKTLEFATITRCLKNSKIVTYLSKYVSAQTFWKYVSREIVGWWWLATLKIPNKSLPRYSPRYNWLFRFWTLKIKLWKSLKKIFHHNVRHFCAYPSWVVVILCYKFALSMTLGTPCLTVTLITAAEIWAGDMKPG